MTDEGYSPFDNEEIARLSALAEEARNRPDFAGPFREAAEGTLSIHYHDQSDNAWAIKYTMPDGSVMRISNRMRPEQVLAQLRGIMADFCGRHLLRGHK